MLTHSDSYYICHDIDINNNTEGNSNGNSSNRVYQIDGECLVIRLSILIDGKKQKKLSAKVEEDTNPTRRDEKEGTTLSTLLISSTTREQRVGECEEDISQRVKQICLFNNKKSIHTQSIEQNIVEGINLIDEKCNQQITKSNCNTCYVRKISADNMNDDGATIVRTLSTCRTEERSNETSIDEMQQEEERRGTERVNERSIDSIIEELQSSESTTKQEDKNGINNNGKEEQLIVSFFLLTYGKYVSIRLSTTQFGGEEQTKIVECLWICHVSIYLINERPSEEDNNIDNNDDNVSVLFLLLKRINRRSNYNDAWFGILQSLSGPIIKRQDEKDKRNVISVSLIDGECVLIILLSKLSNRNICNNTDSIVSFDDDGIFKGTSIVSDNVNNKDGASILVLLSRCCKEIERVTERRIEISTVSNENNRNKTNIDCEENWINDPTINKHDKISIDTKNINDNDDRSNGLIILPKYNEEERNTILITPTYGECIHMHLLLIRLSILIEQRQDEDERDIVSTSLIDGECILRILLLKLSKRAIRIKGERNDENIFDDDNNKRDRTVNSICTSTVNKTKRSSKTGKSSLISNDNSKSNEKCIGYVLILLTKLLNNNNDDDDKTNIDTSNNENIDDSISNNKSTLIVLSTRTHKRESNGNKSIQLGRFMGSVCTQLFCLLPITESYTVLTTCINGYKYDTILKALFVFICLILYWIFTIDGEYQNLQRVRILVDGISLYESSWSMALRLESYLSSSKQQQAAKRGEMSQILHVM